MAPNPKPRKVFLIASSRNQPDRLDLVSAVFALCAMLASFKRKTRAYCTALAGIGELGRKNILANIPAANSNSITPAME